MDQPVKKAAQKAPRRKDDRVVLHFDYDCFYAQVVENQQPALKSLPLGIKQKSILATCNYTARRLGVSKLMSAAEARRVCPQLVLVDGEDLSAFRDVSKRLYGLLRGFAEEWGRAGGGGGSSRTRASSCRVERLGLDEVFVDVTDVVAHNVELLNRSALATSWFCLSREDPLKGFEYDATSFAGCVEGAAAQLELNGGHGVDGLDSPLYVRLLVASHLGRYLRLKLEEQGYTSACGISTNKLLAKLVGNKNKPRNQTTLVALDESHVHSFMDAHTLRKVPGIGGKITHILEDFVLGTQTDRKEHTHDCAVTAGQVRTHPDASPHMFERLLGGPGTERGLNTKVWGLLHGVDDAQVKTAVDTPTQIGIEDTYQGLNTLAEIERELRRIGASLLRRMHVDLVEDIPDSERVLDQGDAAMTTDTSAPTPATKKWIAHPKTIRLTTSPKTSAAEGKPYGWGRASRSQPLPRHVFSFTTPAEQIVDRLANETLLPMFYMLNLAEEQGHWNVGLINVCVTGMVHTGSDSGPGNGRDIAAMFRRQEEVLREFTVYDHDDEDESIRTGMEMGIGIDLGTQVDLSSQPSEKLAPEVAPLATVDLDEEEMMDTDMTMSSQDPDAGIWEDDDNDLAEAERCLICGHLIPLFAMTAHERFHSVEGA